MRKFIRFMLGGYWNDPISNAVGGRSTMVFCWLMVLIAVSSSALIIAGLAGLIA